MLKGGHDVDPRQQTLRAAIEWSYELLGADEQRLFRALSVFAGGCTLEAADEICDADLDVLQPLVDKSLIRFSGERYVILEPIRQYAGEQLDELDESAGVRLRHARWFTELAERSEPELEGDHQDESLNRLDREHDNIRAALAYALDARVDEVALRLAAGSGTFWWIRGYWTEGRRWLETALHTTPTDNPALLFKTLEAAANLAYRQGDDHRGASWRPRRCSAPTSSGAIAPLREDFAFSHWPAWKKATKSSFSALSSKAPIMQGKPATSGHC
jgi:hypothetical protein